MLLLIVILLWCEIMNISISLNAQEGLCCVCDNVFIPKSLSIRHAYVYGGNNAAMFSKCRRGRQPKLSYTITQRMHQFHPLIHQCRARHGMEANKLFWCVFITIKRDFQPPSVAGALRVVRWLPRLSPAATRLCYCEGQSREADIKKMHPAKVIVQSLDALLHGSWHEMCTSLHPSWGVWSFF